MIASVNNDKVKAVVRLHQRKYRETTGLILVEGPHPVEEACAAGLQLESIFVREGETYSCPGMTHVFVTDAVMAKMATTESPVPVLAVFQKPSLVTRRAWNVGYKRILALCGLQDPGNLGTLVRTACAFGFEGIVLVGEQVDPFHPKVIRASAGMVFRIPIWEGLSVESFAQTLQDTKALQVWAADAHEGRLYHTVFQETPLVLLLGSEGNGLPQCLLKLASGVHIPMVSGVESLNVAVAGAILMAEVFQKSSFPASK